MNQRFMALDGLRGVAALLVAAFHTRTAFQINPIDHGYLAVDFFFMLSGFVVAHAYEERLRNGMSFRRFAVARAVRLYPMIALGVLLGTFAAALTWPVPITTVLGAGAAAALVLPIPMRGLAVHLLWPIDPPAWSLFWEIAINGVFALFLFRLRAVGLATLTLISALALLLTARHFHSLEVGYIWSNLWGGLSRVLFGFVVGVALSRIHRARGLPVVRTNIWILSAVLLGCLAFPLSAHKDIFDLVAVLVLFPIIVVAGVSTSAEGALWQWSGRISYPLYLIHAPMLVFFALAVAGRSSSEREAASVVALALYVAVAAVVVKYYDEPVRFFLGNRTRARSSIRVEDRSLATPS